MHLVGIAFCCGKIQGLGAKDYGAKQITFHQI